MTKVKKSAHKKTCYFHDTGTEPYYRDVEVLSKFISERKKIIPAIYTGLCSRHQRKISKTIKQARHLALLPFHSGI